MITFVLLNYPKKKFSLTLNKMHQEMHHLQSLCKLMGSYGTFRHEICNTWYKYVPIRSQRVKTYFHQIDVTVQLTLPNICEMSLGVSVCYRMARLVTNGMFFCRRRWGRVFPRYHSEHKWCQWARECVYRGNRFQVSLYSFFLRDFIFKKTLFKKLQY